MLTTITPTAKTEGILLKLVDFGLASKVNEAKGLVGSPNYISPELAADILSARKRRYVDLHCKSNDVYALGVTFYVLLSAMLPYHLESSSFRLFKMIAKGRYSIPRSIETHYSQMVPLLKSMFEVQEKRFSIEDVLNYTERLHINEYSGELQPIVQSTRNQLPKFDSNSIPPSNVELSLKPANQFSSTSLEPALIYDRGRKRDVPEEAEVVNPSGCLVCFDWFWRKPTKNYK